MKLKNINLESDIQLSSEKAQPNGYASLDSNGKVPTGQLPDIGGGHIIQDEGISVPQRSKMNFKGSGVVVTDNGDTTDVTITGSGGAIDSVNGQVGVVILDADDIDDTSTTNKFVNSDDVVLLSKLAWNIDEDTIDITQSGSVLQVGQETQYQIKGDELTGITNGQLVMASGTDGNSGNIKGKKAISNGTYDPKYILGIATQGIASGVFGKVTQFGKVRRIQTNGANYGETWLEGDILYPNPTTAGGLTKVMPQAPNWKNAVAIVISVHRSNGTLFARVNPNHNLGDLNNVDITTEVTGDLLVRNGTHWINSPVMTETKTWTGFVDNENITVTGNSTNRTVTLSHGTNVIYYWRGQRKVLGTSWTSTRHGTDTSKRYFLYTTDGTNFTWSETAWNFTDTMVALTFYDTTLASWIYIREVHGTYDHESHRIDHNNIGTFRLSGGNPTTGTYTLNTTTDVAITPGFDSAVVADEDLLTTIPAVTEGTYTIGYTNASNIMVFDTTKTFPFNNTASGYINYFLNGVSTQGAALRFYNVYQILVPVGADTNSQKFRTVFLQPQAQYTTLSAAQSEDFRRLNLGNFANLSMESVAYTRLTYGTNASYGTTGKVQLNGLSYLVGSRATQLSISGLTPLTLSGVLQNGNNAGGLGMTNLGNSEFNLDGVVGNRTIGFKDSLGIYKGSIRGDGTLLFEHGSIGDLTTATTEVATDLNVDGLAGMGTALRDARLTVRAVPGNVGYQFTSSDGTTYNGLYAVNGTGGDYGDAKYTFGSYNLFSGNVTGLGKIWFLSTTVETGDLAWANAVYKHTTTGGANPASHPFSGQNAESGKSGGAVYQDGTQTYGIDVDSIKLNGVNINTRFGEVGSKTVDEAAIGNDKILVYKTASGKLEYEAKPSGGGGSQSESIADYQGQAIIGVLGERTFTSAKTLTRCSLDVSSIPVGSNCILELRHQTSSGTNLLSSTLQVATTDTLTNGHKLVSVTGFTDATMDAGDKVVAFLTSIGSTTPSNNPVCYLDFN